MIMDKKYYLLTCLAIFLACFILTSNATAEKISKPVSDTSVKPTLPATKSDDVLNSKKEKRYIKYHTTVKKKSKDRSNKLTKVKWQVKPKKNEYRKRGW